jgi:pilus assembly protein CpaB
VLSGKNPLLIALALGIIAALVAYYGIKAKEKQVRAGWNTVKILCADQDIAEGTELDRDMVSVRDMPEQFVTESFIRIEEDNSTKHDLPFGQRVLVPLKKGDPILITHFEATREAEFSTMINQKGRAVTIETQEKQSVGQWVKPNDHVDIVGTFRDSSNNELKTVTLMQNVLVLATGHINANTAFVPEDDKKYQNVTVLTLPEEAEMLALAQETGTLTLLLRNPEDLDYQEQRKVIDQKSLLAGDRSNELQKKRYNTIQIIRGNKNNNDNGGAAVPAKPE